MSLTHECPYGAEMCPRLQELDERVRALESNISRMFYILYFIAGICAVELGVVMI